MKLWITEYIKAKKIKADEAKYLASAMYGTNNIMRRW